MSKRRTTRGKWRTQPETRRGDKFENYLRGIMPIFGRSLGREVCLAMAYEWAKEVDKLRNQYHAFKEMYLDLTCDERRHAWRCFAHAYGYYRGGRHFRELKTSEARYEDSTRRSRLLLL
jgi:hypothetical protein